MNDHILLHSVILLSMAVVTVAIARRVHFPPILSYIIVGILVGPYGLGWIQSEENIHFLAEFGIVFLLFSLGLEFSVSQMIAMRKLVFGLGAFQVGITAVLFYFIATALGMDSRSAIVIGSAFALSSTAIVIKQLIEQSELQTRHGKAALGILIFQDLMAIPLLILIPSLGQSSGDEQLITELLKALGNGLIVIVVMLLAGRLLLRPLFHEVASAKSAELFTLAVLTVVLGAAAFTEELGISMTLGAFIAGVMLGETEYRHQIEADIRPFQDVLLGLFFVTVGMMISPQLIFDHFWAILGMTIMIVALKFTTIFSVLKLFKKSSDVALRTALSLAQVGEFGLVVMTLAFSFNLLPEALGQQLLTAAVLSMMISPFLIKFNGQIAKRLTASAYQENVETLVENIESQSHFLKDHVIICGFGRVGQTVAKFLSKNAIPYIALDLDIQRVKEAQDAGEPVFFGDCANPTLLKAAHIHQAKSAIITFDDFHTSLKTLRAIKNLDSKLPTLVRTRDDAHLDEFIENGATEVVPETFEASIMLASHLLLMLGVSPSKVLKESRQARQDRYKLLEDYYPGEGGTAEAQKHQVMNAIIHPITLEQDNAYIGQTVADLPLSEYDVELKAVNRGGVRGDEPEDGTMLREEDKLVVKGSPENIAKLEKHIQKATKRSKTKQN